MAGFRKSKSEQSALKIAIYGPPGSGKTFTSLLMAEGLARIDGKRIAVVDTENGTVFYDKTVKERDIHPEGFDFDVIKTRSITDVLDAVRGIKPTEYSAIIVDSITHLWEAARQAYSGKQTSAGTIPFHAWGKIKKPYKDLIGLLMNSPLHVIICGRQGIDYETDEETDELKAVGLKMKAEGETPYEPHILLRMEIVKSKKTQERAKVVAFAEKDRTGVLAGRSFVNPTFDSLCRPLLPLLGLTQDQIETADQAATKDSERLEADDAKRITRSSDHLRTFTARLNLAKTYKEVMSIGNELTTEIKAEMTTENVATLRGLFLERQKQTMNPEGAGG
jgi:hypothetical protein